MRIGSIGNSTWETEAQVYFLTLSYWISNWPSAQEALLTINPETGRPYVDVIYRDATEIKPIVYKDPELSLKYLCLSCLIRL